MIRPYLPNGQRMSPATASTYHIRPIKPSDIELYPEFLARISPDDVRLRFLAPRKNFPDEMLKRLTQLDYDRDMAFVALDKKRERLLVSVGSPATPIARLPNMRSSFARTCRVTASAGRCCSTSSTTREPKGSAASKASSSTRTTRC